jgi:Lon protease-like protein
MAAACMRTSSPFGVCLISAGAEVGAAAAPYAVGTLARISDWDMEQLGLLQVAALGGQRFRLLSSSSAADKLLQGEVELIEDDGPLPLPPEFSRLLPLLRRIVDEAGPTRIGEPHRLDDAEWVGYRLSEALPLPNQVKQKLLELADPLARLAILEKSLDQRQLLD